MKNTLVDLNNYLFQALEELQTAETTEELRTAASKATSVCGIARTITDNAKVMLDATKLQIEYGRRGDINMPEMLENKHE